MREIEVVEIHIENHSSVRTVPIWQFWLDIKQHLDNDIHMEKLGVWNNGRVCECVGVVCFGGGGLGVNWFSKVTKWWRKKFTPLHSSGQFRDFVPFAGHFFGFSFVWFFWLLLWGVCCFFRMLVGR